MGEATVVRFEVLEDPRLHPEIEALAVLPGQAHSLDDGIPDLEGNPSVDELHERTLRPGASQKSTLQSGAPEHRRAIESERGAHAFEAVQQATVPGDPAGDR